LAAASGRPAEQIEFRVAASVAQFGIAARLICPVFGSAVLDAEIPIDVAYARWVPALGGPFRLSLPETAFPPRQAMAGAPIVARPAVHCSDCSAGRSALS
jgi:hypothetical protein